MFTSSKHFEMVQMGTHFNHFKMVEMDKNGLKWLKLLKWLFDHWRVGTPNNPFFKIGNERFRSHLESKSF